MIEDLIELMTETTRSSRSIDRDDNRSVSESDYEDVLRQHRQYCEQRIDEDLTAEGYHYPSDCTNCKQGETTCRVECGEGGPY